MSKKSAEITLSDEEITHILSQKLDEERELDNLLKNLDTLRSKQERDTDCLIKSSTSDEITLSKSLAEERLITPFFSIVALLSSRLKIDTTKSVEFYENILSEFHTNQQVGDIIDKKAREGVFGDEVAKTLKSEQERDADLFVTSSTCDDIILSKSLVEEKLITPFLNIIAFLSSRLKIDSAQSVKSYQNILSEICVKQIIYEDDKLAKEINIKNLEAKILAKQHEIEKKRENTLADALERKKEDNKRREEFKNLQEKYKQRKHAEQVDTLDENSSEPQTIDLNLKNPLPKIDLFLKEAGFDHDQINNMKEIVGYLTAEDLVRDFFWPDDGEKIVRQSMDNIIPISQTNSLIRKLKEIGDNQ